MSARGFVDWGLAERVALALGGNGGTPAAFDQDAVDAACADAVDLVLDYSRLRPAGQLPQPELVDRAVASLEAAGDRWVIPVCWYVDDWFAAHPSRAGILRPRRTA